MSEQLKFDVLLAQVQGQRGLEYTIRGATLLKQRKQGDVPVADSVQAVQDAGLLQVPTYKLVQSRALAPKSDPAWSRWHDTLGERHTMNVAKGRYADVSDGLSVVDIQNAGLFLPRHDVVRAAVLDRKLTEKGAFVVSDQDKDLLLAENMAYQWDGQELKTVPVQVFTSYGEFLEASGTAEFQRSLLQDMSVVYAVVRSAEEARMNPIEYQSLSEQRENPDLIIPSGGKQPLGVMLDQAASFKWNIIGSFHDGYQKEGGRGVVLNNDYGVIAGNHIVSTYGRSVGVAPEALARSTEATSIQLDSRVADSSEKTD